MLAWQEAVDRAIEAVQQAEALAKREFGNQAQTYAQISFAWSNIGMMLEAQEAAEDAAA